MAQQIKIFNEEGVANFTQTFSVNEQRVELQLLWNNRSQYWYIQRFTLLDTGDFLRGIKIVPYFLLFDPYMQQIPNFEGDFYVSPLDSEADNTENITFDNFGVTFVLLYLTPDEIRIWKEINGYT